MTGSPYINRFLSADSIVPGISNPQAFNRYSYVLGNPLRYTDPTGHRACSTNKECEEMGITPSGKTDLKLKGYTLWERKALRNLHNKGGAEGVHAVEYIMQNNVHLVFNPETQPAAWHPFSNDIFLDSGQYSENSDPAAPYMLSLIAHEAIHLEQGSLIAITVAGETEAWQVGFAVHRNITGQLPSGDDTRAASRIMSLDANNMRASDLQNARDWMKDFDPGYRSDLLLPWNESNEYFDTFFFYIPPTFAIP